MQDKITKEKIEKYRVLTTKALKTVKGSVIKGREKDAQEIINIVSDYLSDSTYFENKDDLINSFAALSYAHGWLDSGVRLGVFDVKDDSLFTIK